MGARKHFRPVANDAARKVVRIHAHPAGGWGSAKYVFRGGHYSSTSFAQWLSHLPSELVQAYFNFSADTVLGVSQRDAKVVGAWAASSLCWPMAAGGMNDET